MSSSGRRALFGATYLVASLAPLTVAMLVDPLGEKRSFAVELAVAFGFIAFALFAFELALVSRLRTASEPFGTDVLMMFHRQAGLLAALIAAVHVLLLLVHAASWRLLDPTSGSLASRAGALGFWGALAIAASSLLRRRMNLRYELWRSLHQVLAVVIVLSMSVHALAARGYSRSPAVAAVTWAYAGACLALLAWHRLIRPLALLRKPWRVVENRDEGGDTRTLVLEPVGHDGLAFAPGQFAWLITGSSPFHREQHPISFSSSAAPVEGRRIEFSIKALGDWSRVEVPAIAPGTRVWVEGPFGAFTPGRTPARGFVLIAGGIGVTPMRSMLRTFRDRRDQRPIVLFYAANRPERAVYRDELARLEHELDLEVVYVYESPPAGWQGERGYVTAEVLRRHLPEDGRSWQFFVCGPPAMMDSVERILRTMGVAAGRVHTERFDMVWSHATHPRFPSRCGARRGAGRSLVRVRVDRLAREARPRGRRRVDLRRIPRFRAPLRALPRARRAGFDVARPRRPRGSLGRAPRVPGRSRERIPRREPGDRRAPAQACGSVSALSVPRGSAAPIGGPFEPPAWGLLQLPRREVGWALAAPAQLLRLSSRSPGCAVHPGRRRAR